MKRGRVRPGWPKQVTVSDGAPLGVPVKSGITYIDQEEFLTKEKCVIFRVIHPTYFGIWRSKTMWEGGDDIDRTLAN